jgi:hypothetical protein
MRTVTGTLLSASGAPIKDAAILFRPMAVYAYTTAGEYVSTAPVNVATNENGTFSVDLYATEDFSTTSSKFLYCSMGYRIEIPSLGLVRNVQVPYGVTPISWGDLTLSLG